MFASEVEEHSSALPRILGLGVACVDMIACVAEYPKADEKIRAESVTLLSGGNVGNTLTAISRLGAADSSILTKVGKDSNGEFVMNDLREAGIDVTNVVASESAPTLLVYVIVDKLANRTCIASPNEEELTPSEVKMKLQVVNQRTGLQEGSTILDNVQVREDNNTISCHRLFSLLALAISCCNYKEWPTLSQK